jgi:hypothetical protein
VSVCVLSVSTVSVGMTRVILERVRRASVSMLTASRLSRYAECKCRASKVSVTILSASMPSQYSECHYAVSRGAVFMLDV